MRLTLKTKRHRGDSDAIEQRVRDEARQNKAAIVDEAGVEQTSHLQDTLVEQQPNIELVVVVIGAQHPSLKPLGISD